MTSMVQIPNGALCEYLLAGSPDAPAPEQELFEESYFVNNELFLALLEEGDRLMLEFARGRLDDREIERFKRKCATNADWRAKSMFFSALAALDKPRNLFLEKYQTSDETHFDSSSLMGISH